MSLHRPIVGIRPLGVNGDARAVAASICAASAGVHAALVPEHYREKPALGAAFAVSAVALAWAALLLRRPAGSRLTRIAPPAVLLGVAACYLLSRGTGLPLLIPEPEELDALGLVTTLAELLAAAVAVRLTHDRKERR
jgi:hypothetical protein